MTVNRKAVGRTTLVSIVVPYAEPLPDDVYVQRLPVKVCLWTSVTDG
jgi:hypothetical protein